MKKTTINFFLAIMTLLMFLATLFPEINFAPRPFYRSGLLRRNAMFAGNRVGVNVVDLELSFKMADQSKQNWLLMAQTPALKFLKPIRDDQIFVQLRSIVRNPQPKQNRRLKVIAEHVAQNFPGAQAVTACFIMAKDEVNPFNKAMILNENCPLKDWKLQ